MTEIASRIAASELPSFQDYLDLGSNAGVDDERYFPGAVMCDMVFAATGASGIETLFRAGRGDQDLYRAIQSTTGLDRAAFQQAWRQRILEFAN
jgi:hypothetical protein